MFGFIKDTINSTCNIVSDVASGELPSKEDLCKVADATLDASLGITAISAIKDLLED